MKNHEITHISQTTRIEGTISVQSDLRIAGELKGSLTCSGNLILENTGKIEADIKVNSATFAGEVKGNIIADEKVTLVNTAKITGNITTRQIVIQEGAYYQGNCHMDEKKPVGK